MSQTTFWIVQIVVLGVVVGWAVEILRRLGDHTKILRQISEDLAAIRAGSARADRD